MNAAQHLEVATKKTVGKIQGSHSKAKEKLILYMRFRSANQKSRTYFMKNFLLHKIMVNELCTSVLPHFLLGFFWNTTEFCWNPTGRPSPGFVNWDEGIEGSTNVNPRCA